MTFRVAAISTKPNSFGLHGHVLIAPTGEAWEVARCRLDYQPAWELNKDVEVPVDTDGRRMWEAVNVEIPRSLPWAPRKVLNALYGKEKATATAARQ